MYPDKRQLVRAIKDVHGMFRVSRGISEEFGRTVYGDWELTLSESLVLSHQIKSTPYNKYIEVTLLHARFGAVHLPLLRDHMGERAAQFHRKLPHHLWKMVNVEFACPDPADPGDLMVRRADIKLMIDTFKLHCPRIVTIRPQENCTYTTSICDSTGIIGSDFQVLLKPFGILFEYQKLSHGEDDIRLVLHYSGKTQSILRQSKWATQVNHSGSPATIVKPTVGLETLSDEGLCLDSVLGDHASEARMDAMLDYYLDFLPGKSTRGYRCRRWFDWNHGGYEFEAIRNIKHLDVIHRNISFAALAERWVVCMGLSALVDAEIESNVNEWDYLSEAEDEARDAQWKIFSRDPHRRNRLWKRMLRKNSRGARVLVTTHGIRFENSDRNVRDPGEILYMLAPQTLVMRN